MSKYFAIMLNLCSSQIGELLCSNLCQHNVPRPNVQAECITLGSVPYLLTVALVCLSTERYHCLSMEGRCLAISMNAELDSCSMDGQRLTAGKCGAQ